MSMATFTKAKLGNCLDLYNGKSVKTKLKGAFFVYGSNGKIGYTDEFLYDNSIILGRVGAYCGSVQIEKDRFWASDNTIVVKNNKDTDLIFLYYLLKHLNLNQYAGGAAQPLITQNLLRQIQVSIPDLSTQSRIASVLSAYDDLIEVNEKRIKILEEMAQRLYTEWFVKFKFTGHEKARMVSVETGLKPVSTKNDLIPEGWEVKTLGDKLNILKGKNITKNTIVDGKIPVVAGGLSPAYYHNKANTKNPVITVSASGANAGFVNLYQEEIWASDCSYIDNNATPFVYFYYLFLKNKQIEISKLQRGSAQPHVYPKDLMRLLILDIPEILMFNFECKVKQVFDAIKNLNKQNQKLSSIRDLLIPQLVTGERELK